ncbi:hypothetical protein [Elizabethkingia anophelis]|uniref:Uncharacterized protein n=1 Tax=Elizabethkingia anophelis TaxID=1117645 RepID=A0A494J8U6_9FLAO|nr:hypothetical protein [Elizabethkingia anophelis]AQX51351.1 hypothetical protein AYC66_11965 [Elizabethkingia anophelis]MCT4196662.1 hypothetical protein [Elizabethkingia anophelis]MCT4225394.1 hypothetical protein [Elizabethkingia anophelis]MCT4306985.1 hypothetical protein [Elizabethkingia anophelis]MDV2472744.1 hypothetical protein [Elizabethkingia anophelis]
MTLKTSYGDFRQTEIKKLKQLRNTVYIALFAINCGILFFFTYNFYVAYNSRNITKAFFIPYILPTILSIQAILLLAIGPLIYITYKRFKIFMGILRNLDKEYMTLYEIYISKIARVWAGIPPYVFTKDGFIILRTFGNKIIPYQQIIRISSKTIKIPGASFKYRLQISTEKQGNFTFTFTQEIQSVFAIENIKLKNPDVWINR